MTNKPKALLEVLENLNKRKKETTIQAPYKVPSEWIKPGEAKPVIRVIKETNPYDFLIEHIESILEYNNPKKQINYKGTKGFWIKDAIVYNIFPRVASAFDHNGDGIIGGNNEDITINSNGLRETGTFLKTLSLLGHICSLKCNVVYFLPITSIGKDGNKGDLGSPYAIKNPYELDEKLSDPLCDLDINTQFKALVEACHILGMKVILEFVFRTGAKDSDWIPEHPDWFYWIDNRIRERTLDMTGSEMENAYGPPVFTENELQMIKSKAESKDFNNLPPPHPQYTDMFKLAPEGSHKISKTDRYIGESVDPKTKEIVKTRIPGAFADWPPDDIQPPWTDVTYLKLYKDENPENPEFNYIAYNTIRMYDKKLAREELANRPLWDKIRDIIPHYQNSFGINGVMVDMGHALPSSLMMEIVKKARTIDCDFAFLSENFTVDHKSLESGYNVVLGYSWSVEYKKDGLLQLLKHAGISGMPIHFFATSESHNTPRSATKKGGIKFSKFSYIINCFIPKGIPFIHNGFELGETYPINTGLDFTPEELSFYRDKPLALFDRHSFNWTSDDEISGFISKINEIRLKHKDILDYDGKDNFSFIQTNNDTIIGFIRSGSDSYGSKSLIVLVNSDFENQQYFRLNNIKTDKIFDIFNETEYDLTGNDFSGSIPQGSGCVLYIRN